MVTDHHNIQRVLMGSRDLIMAAAAAAAEITTAKAAQEAKVWWQLRILALQ